MIDIQPTLMNMEMFTQWNAYESASIRTSYSLRVNITCALFVHFEVYRDWNNHW